MSSFAPFAHSRHNKTATGGVQEQYCQTGASLGSLPDASLYCDTESVFEPSLAGSARVGIGFRLNAADGDRLSASTSASTDNSDNDDDNDYDDVATDVDNASLHLTLGELAEKNAQRNQHSSGGPAAADAAAQRLGCLDALPQVWAALIANLLPIQAGINMAYSAILIPQLSHPQAEIRITKDEASWFASLVTISLPLGSLAIGPLIDRYGRKRVSVLATVPFLAGWLLISTARSVHALYAARLLLGAAGGLSTVSIIYVSEIADARLRPALLGLNSVFVSLGILVTGVLGTFLDWRRIAVCYAGMTAVSALLMAVWLPESPRWLRMFRVDAVRRQQKAVRWLYRREELYEANWQRLLDATPAPQLKPDIEMQPVGGKKQLHYRSNGIYESPTETTKPDAWYAIYLQPHVYRPLTILLLMFVFQQLCGAYVVIFYAVNLFLKIGGQFGEGINEYGAMLLLGAIRFAMSIVAALLSQKVGRRRLMFISGLGMAACMLVAGLYMHYEQMLEDYYAGTENPADDIDPERKGNNTVVLGCVLGYVAFCALGFMVIPWILIGEVLPTQVKGVIGGVVIAAAYVLMFGAVKAFPYVLDALEVEGVFFVFATTSLAGVVFVWVYLPETLGRSFEEIERRFAGRQR